MNKTISINIAGTIFYIEEDAYAALDEYLKSIKNHFQSYPEHEEIVSDMEGRIAEQFLSGKENQKDKIVTLTEVESLIKTMGRVEDFESEGEQHTSEKKESKSRRLYRDEENGMLAGVSAGLGAYFGIDPIIFRLLFVLVTLSGGAGILIYIVLWIIMQPAKTAEQKSEMRGSPMKLSEMEQAAKDKINAVKKNGSLKNIVNAIGTVVRIIVIIFAKLLGIIIAIAAAAALVSIVFSYAVALFNSNSPYVDFPLAQIITGWQYYAAISLAFALVIIPAWMFMMLAITILKGKRVFPQSVVVGLIVVWFLFLTAGGTLAIKYGPEYEAKYRNLPEVQRITKTYDLKDFTKIDAGSAVRVNVKQGSTYSMVANGRQIDLDRMDVKVENNVLTLRQKSDDRKICFFCFDWSEGVTVEMTMPNLEEASLSGASRVTMDKLNPQNFKLTLSGASKAVFTEVATQTVDLQMSGASQVQLAGVAKSINVKLSGSSRLDAQELTLEDATIDSSGASSTWINSSKTLNVEASGASRVIYLGNPVIEDDLSGASKVMPFDRQRSFMNEKSGFPVMPEFPEMPKIPEI